MKLIGSLRFDNALDLAGEILLSKSLGRHFKSLPNLKENDHTDEWSEIDTLASFLKKGRNIEIREKVASIDTFRILRDNGLKSEEGHDIIIYAGEIGSDTAHFVYGWSYKEREFYLSAVLDKTDYEIFLMSLDLIKKQLNVNLSKGLMPLLREMGLKQSTLNRLKADAIWRIASAKDEGKFIFYPYELMIKDVAALDDEGCYICRFFTDIFLVQKLFALDILFKHKISANSLDQWISRTYKKYKKLEEQT